MATEHPWTDFLDWVMPNLTACPTAVAIHNIKLATINYFGKTFVWRYDHDPIPLQLGVAEYFWETPTDTDICRIEDVWCDVGDGPQPIYAKSQAELKQLYSHWPSETGTPQWRTGKTQESFLLVPYPNVEGEITAKICLHPTLDAAGVDEEHFVHYVDDIANGALARLYAMKNKPWSDAGLAQYHDGLYKAAVSSMRNYADRGFQAGPMRVRPVSKIEV